MPTLRQVRRVGKPLVFTLCCLPLAGLALQTAGLAGGLGANPVETFQDTLGTWGIRLLLVTLAVSPLAWALGQPWPLQFRRMLGLFAFFYAALHFLNWLALDQAFDWPVIVEDLIERPFIAFGAAALALLVPLAITSTAGWRRRLGSRWHRLHRLVYVAAGLACVHFWWQAKQNFTEPAVCAAAAVLLLGARAARARRQRAVAQRL